MAISLEAESGSKLHRGTNWWGAFVIGLAGLAVRSDAEQHERDDERVKIAFGTEPELVLFGLLAPRSVAPDEEERLVPGVGYRVHCLRQQRGGSGDDEGDELSGRDAEVRRQRGKDGTLAAAAPAVPASPAPVAPSSDSAVGDTTWPTSMSGISAAIGTR